MTRKHLLATLGLLMFLSLLVLAGLQEQQEEWQLYGNEVVNLSLPGGTVERCLTCHQGIEEISTSHPIETFGCVSCHGGDGQALDKERAHEGLLGGRNPGALTAAGEACGQEGCHINTSNLYRSPVETVPLIPMATKAGEITELAYTYGWQKDLLSRYGVFEVTGYNGQDKEQLEERDLASDKLELFSPSNNPLQQKLSENCLADCHLNTGAGEIETAQHLAGCAACHTPYRSGGTYQGEDPTINRAEPGHAPEHKLTIAIPYTQCNACHNQGIHSISKIEFLPREDIPVGAITDPNADKNQAYYIPGAQYALCEVELDCIDCHTHNEVMGDGHLTGNKKAAQTIACYDCHGTIDETAKTVEVDSETDNAIWASHYFHDNFPEVKVGDQLAVTDEDEAYVNVRMEGSRMVLYSKVSDKEYTVPQVKGSGCDQLVDEQAGEDCHRCHDVSNN